MIRGTRARCRPVVLSGIPTLELSSRNAGRRFGWCGLVLCLAAASLLAASPAAGVAGYGDVAAGRYFTEPVQWSVDNDITAIDGNCFLPDAPVSRGETALYIWNMEGQPAAKATHSFTDVTTDAQNPAISWMAETGVTTGTSDTTFSPQDTLERAKSPRSCIAWPTSPPHLLILL